MKSEKNLRNTIRQISISDYAAHIADILYESLNKNDILITYFLSAPWLKKPVNAVKLYIEQREKGKGRYIPPEKIEYGSLFFLAEGRRSLKRFVKIGKRGIHEGISRFEHKGSYHEDTTQEEIKENIKDYLSRAGISNHMGSVYKCPECGADVDENWKRCPYCGAKTEITKCPNCGSSVASNWKFCPYCEERL